MKTSDVKIRDGVIIHTVHICDNPHLCGNGDSPASATPLVMVHGIGGAIPAFHKNYHHLARDRCVYGIDLPGFGLSERVEFPDDPDGCERQMVDMIEQWRTVMKFDKIILLGHSFGGYVSAAYALQHHEHVQHLVLLDPWGMFSQDDDASNEKTKTLMKKMAQKVCTHLKVDPFTKFASFGHIVGKAEHYLEPDIETSKIKHF